MILSSPISVVRHALVISALVRASGAEAVCDNNISIMARAYGNGPPSPAHGGPGCGPPPKQLAGGTPPDGAGVECVGTVGVIELLLCLDILLEPGIVCYAKEVQVILQLVELAQFV